MLKPAAFRCIAALDFERRVPIKPTINFMWRKASLIPRWKAVGHNNPPGSAKYMTLRQEFVGQSIGCQFKLALIPHAAGRIVRTLKLDCGVIYFAIPGGRECFDSDNIEVMTVGEQAQAKGCVWPVELRISEVERSLPAQQHETTNSQLEHTTSCRIDNDSEALVTACCLCNEAYISAICSVLVRQTRNSLTP